PEIRGREVKVAIRSRSSIPEECEMAGEHYAAAPARTTHMRLYRWRKSFCSAARTAMVRSADDGYHQRPRQRGRRAKEGEMADTLYQRLGGYDAIAAVSDDLLVRLMADAQLGRFWHVRAADSLWREKQLLIDFLC